MWDNTIGGNSTDNLHSLDQTTDGGYVLGGESVSDMSGDKTETSVGEYDYWIVKINYEGNVEWDNTIGGSETDYLSSVSQTTDGGYILGGYSFSDDSGDKLENRIGEGTSTDYWLVKLSDSCYTPSIVFLDNDGDGFGTDLITGFACAFQPGFSLVEGDCDDNNPGVFEGNIETSNGIDDNCNGIIDEGTLVIFYADADGDGFGVLTSTLTTNEGLPVGYSANADDCNDTYSLVNPLQPEICNNCLDDNCDGNTDEPACTMIPGIEWQETYGSTGSNFFTTLAITPGGGYILGGYVLDGIGGDKSEPPIGGYDYWVLKINSTGSIEWENTIGGINDDYLYSIGLSSDGGYILGGYSNSNVAADKTEANIGGFDYWVVKLDENGDVEWDNTIGGTGDDYLFSVGETSDGGFILGGYSNSNISGDKTENSIGLEDYWVVKLNADGDVQWNNTMGGSGIDKLRSVEQTSDGGYILGGSSFSSISGDKTEPNMGGYDYWIVKINSEGTVEWDNTIGGTSTDELREVHQTADGGYIVGGYSNSHANGDKSETLLGKEDYWVLKLNSDDGSIQWQNTIGGDRDDLLQSVQQTFDGGYILGGSSKSSVSGDKTEPYLDYSWEDYWIVKLDDAGTVVWDNTIGGSKADLLYEIQQNIDGSYILGGRSESPIDGDKTVPKIGDISYWIIKLQSFAVTLYADADGDGYGSTDADTIMYSCTSIPAGFAADNMDCNDADASINPEAPEIFNGIDDNCNGLIDEGCAIASSFTSFPFATLAGLTWNETEGAVKYRVRYKPVGTAVWEYDYASDGKNQIVLNDLTCNTEYEWGVTSICAEDGSSSSVYSPSEFFTTGACRLSNDNQNTTFNIYPNPATDDFTVNLTLNNSAGGQVFMNIYNLVGEVVYIQEFALIDGILSEHIELDLPGGVYIVNLRTGDDEYMQELIIQK